MSTAVSITDLKRMTASELRKEISSRRAEVAKMRMGLEMQSEKNHAAHRTAKRDIARMIMVLDDMEKTGRTEKTERTGKTNAMKIPSKSAQNPVKSPGSEKKAKTVSKKKSSSSQSF